MKSKTFFISTNSSTQVFARQVDSMIRAMGHNTFLYVHEIGINQNWTLEMAKGLDQSDFILCLVSNGFLASRPCMDEMGYGYAHNNLINVKLEPGQLPGQFEQRIYIDLSKCGNDTNLALQKLQEALISFLKGKRDILVSTPVPKFKKNEIGIMLCQLDGDNEMRFNIAKQWASELETEFQKVAKKYRLKFVTYPQPLTSSEQAEKMLKDSSAKLIVWGEVLGNLFDSRGHAVPDMLNINYTSSAILADLLPTEARLKGTEISRKVNPETGIFDVDTYSIFVRNTGDMEYLVQTVIMLAEYKRGNWEKVEEICTQLISMVDPLRFPSLRTDVAFSFRAYANSGISDKGKNQNALNDYTQALNIMQSIGITPATTLIHNRALLRIEVDSSPLSYQQSIDEISWAIQMEPQNPLYYHSRGRLWSLIGQKEQALADWNQCMMLDPLDFTSRFLRAQLLVQFGKYQDAINDAERILEHDQRLKMGLTLSTKFNLHFLLGRCHFFLKRFDIAENNFTKALQYVGIDELSLLYRATCRYYLGKYVLGLEDINRYFDVEDEENIEPSAFELRKELYRIIQGK